MITKILMIGYLIFLVAGKWSQINADLAYLAAVLRGTGFLP